MNFETLIKIAVISYITLFMLCFIYKNMTTKIKTGNKIRAKNKDVVINSSLTTLIFISSLLSIFSVRIYLIMIPIIYLDITIIKIIGIVLLGLSLFLGIIASTNLKTSWRVGVLKSQKVDLVNNGLYKYSRNPYFISYFISYLGLLFISPTIILSVIIIITIISFNMMIKKEEKYLKDIHGDKYTNYCKKTPRYLFFTNNN